MKEELREREVVEAKELAKQDAALISQYQQKDD